MYAEGGDLGYANNTSALWPYFGTSYLGDGNASGNVSSLTGEAGTFAEGLSFGYPYAQGPDAWVDVFGANGGQLLMRDQGNTGRAVCNEADGYRTVCSAVIYGALGVEDRVALMSEYVDFLTVGAGTVEPSVPGGAGPRIGAEPNPVRLGNRVSLALPAGARGFTVHDATGRLVAGGTAGAGGTADWDLHSGSGRLVNPGTYFVRPAGPDRPGAEPLVVVR